MLHFHMSSLGGIGMVIMLSEPWKSKVLHCLITGILFLPLT